MLRSYGKRKLLSRDFDVYLIKLTTVFKHFALL